MKLGVAGLLGDGSAQAVRRVRELGFGAASWHLPSMATARDLVALQRTRDALETENVALVQLLPPDYPSLVHPDPLVRSEGISALGAVLAAAETLGAESVYVRPGSLNANGPWTPHADNHAPETRERLVESLVALVPLAEEIGIPLALEAHVVSPLDTVAVVREVLNRVASPMLRFNADPVNLVGTLGQAYHTTELINELFDQVGDAVICAHAKDVTVGERLVLHLDECIPGQGLLDHATFLRRFDACCPRGAVLIEHLPIERVPEARRALLEFAARAGLRFEELD